jgi:hypothetical protein
MLRIHEDLSIAVDVSDAERTLYSFNVRDYCRLHAESLGQGRSHSWIIVAKKQNYSVGEQIRRLLKLIATKSAEEMSNSIECLTGGSDRDFRICHLCR